MTNKKYTIGELAAETANEMGLPRAVRAMQTCAGRVAEVPGLLYAAPTIYRRLEERYNHESSTSKKSIDINGQLMARTVGGLIFLIPTMVASLVVDYRIAVIPVATNLVSWAYENVRSAKKKLEERGK